MSANEQTTNEKLWKIINPKGIIEGLKAGFIPAFKYSIDNPCPYTRLLVLKTHELIQMWTDYLNGEADPAIDEYLEGYTAELIADATKPKDVKTPIPPPKA